MAREYIDDTTSPLLRTFSVNISSGILSLTFDETVNISTFMSTELTLIDSQFPVTNYTIQNPGILLTDDDSPIVTFQLHIDDLNSIKLDTALFATIGTSYISYTPTAVIDMSGNLAAALFVANASAAGEFEDDDIPA